MSTIRDTFARSFNARLRSDQTDLQMNVAAVEMAAPARVPAAMPGKRTVWAVVIGALVAIAMLTDGGSPASSSFDREFMNEARATIDGQFARGEITKSQRRDRLDAAAHVAAN